MVITDIKNTKIRVESEEHSKDIYKALTRLGFYFKGSHSFISHVTHYFAEKYGYLTYQDDGDEEFFYKCSGDLIFFYNGEFHDKPQDEQSGEIEWKNGDIAFFEGCSHDEIKFIGLSGNKAVAICECITDDRRVILDKFWVSDLLKERPLSKEEIEKQSRLEVAYDLYLCGWHKGVTGWGNNMSFEQFCVSQELGGDFDYLAIVDKTGYRKGEL